jgi:hypothetical protein
MIYSSTVLTKKMYNFTVLYSKKRTSPNFELLSHSRGQDSQEDPSILGHLPACQGAVRRVGRPGDSCT